MVKCVTRSDTHLSCSQRTTRIHVFVKNQGDPLGPAVDEAGRHYTELHAFLARGSVHGEAPPCMRRALGLRTQERGALAEVGPLLHALTVIPKYTGQDFDLLVDLFATDLSSDMAAMLRRLPELRTRLAAMEAWAQRVHHGCLRVVDIVYPDPQQYKPQDPSLRDQLTEGALHGGSQFLEALRIFVLADFPHAQPIRNYLAAATPLRYIVVEHRPMGACGELCVREIMPRASVDGQIARNASQNNPHHWAGGLQAALDNMCACVRAGAISHVFEIPDGQPAGTALEAVIQAVGTRLGFTPEVCDKEQLDALLYVDTALVERLREAHALADIATPPDWVLLD